MSPRRGFRRECVEDALKLLLEWEERGEAPHPLRLAGALELTQKRAGDLLEELRRTGWVEGDPPRLSDEGRRHAAYVVRAHRLYETWLARSTGLPETEWHRRAHEVEHRLTPDQTAALATSLGQPAYDPHGDPIPPATGDAPPPRGRPLSECSSGWAGRVVHVEDEPAERYRRLVDEGFSVGVQLRVLDMDRDGVRLRMEGRDIALSIAEARQLTVEELPAGAAFDERIRRLSDLRLGERAVVSGLSFRVRGLMRDRLLHLGFVPGSTVEVEMVSPAGDPVAYRIRGGVIALRREQAQGILIRPAEEGG